MILVTCPGKFGDILWSCATARAIAETYGEPVDFITSQAYGSIAPLLRQQPYFNRVLVDDQWLVQDAAPMTPRTPGGEKVTDPGGLFVSMAQRNFHLGYDGWPQRALPFEHWRLARGQQREADPTLAAVELGRSWITVARVPGVNYALSVGFSDEHFELKYGLTKLLRRRFGMTVLAPIGSRWEQEGTRVYDCNWEEAADSIVHSRVFLGCCSALHVLAVALGTPVVLMEPNPMRHNVVFYPLGKVGPQVTLVLGNDGLPTFDARAVAAMVESALARKVPAHG